MPSYDDLASGLTPEERAQWERQYVQKPWEVPEGAIASNEGGPVPSASMTSYRGGEKRRNSLGEVLPEYRPPTPPSSGPTVPVYNSAGDKIGERPAADPNPLFQNPFRPIEQAPAPAAGREPVQVTYGPDAPDKRDHRDGATFYDAGEGAGGGGPVEVIPGGMQLAESKTTTQKGVNISDPTKAAYAAADAGRRDAAEQGRDAGVKAATAEAAYLKTFAGAQEEHANELRKRAGERKENYDREQFKLQSLRDGVNSGTIDPNQKWASMSAFSKFATALSVITGAAAASLNGGENPGLKILNDSIAQNIDAQKTILANNRGKFEAQRTLMGDLIAAGHNEQQAEHGAWVAYLEKAKTELAAQAATAKIPAVQAQYAAAIADVNGMLGQRLERFDTVTQDKVISEDTEKYRPPQVIGGGGGGEGLTGKEETDANDLSKELTKSGVPEQRAGVGRLLELLPEKGEIDGIGGVHGLASIAGGKVEKAERVAYSLFGGQRGQAIRQAADTLFNKQLKDESGAAVSDQEMDRQKAAFYGSRDAASARRALDAYSRRLDAIEATVRSGHKGNVNRAQKVREQGTREELNRKQVPRIKGAE